MSAFNAELGKRGEMLKNLTNEQLSRFVQSNREFFISTITESDIAFNKLNESMMQSYIVEQKEEQQQEQQQQEQKKDIKLSDLTEAERVELFKTDKELFNRLIASEKPSTPKMSRYH